MRYFLAPQDPVAPRRPKPFKLFQRLLTALLLLGLTPCARASAPGVQVSTDLLKEVDPRYLSIALDTSVLLGGTWWTRRQALDLQQPDLLTLTRALAPAYLRVGGTDADKVFYALPGSASQTRPAHDSLVLDADRWEALTTFARQVQLPLIFALNAGPGPRDAAGRWQIDNARSLLAHATQRQDPVAVWELGNEINGFGPLHGFWLSGQQYGQDLHRARQLLAQQAPGTRLAGPASAYWPLLGEPLAVAPAALRSGGAALDIVSWHYYPQQSARCPLRTRPAGLRTLLEPAALNEMARQLAHVRRAQQQDAAGKPIWLGETGHAQCGGAPGISDRFVSSLWWLDQLGLGATLPGLQLQVRQALVGSDYGLLDEHSLKPRPDYWASLLWQRLMGPRVLQLRLTGQNQPRLRAYAHCHPQSGWTALLINLDPEKALSLYWPYPRERSQLYQLSAPALDSPELQLNGQTLRFDGQLSPLKSQPLASSQLQLPPASASFVQVNLPNWPGCQPRS